MIKIYYVETINDHIYQALLQTATDNGWSLFDPSKQKKRCRYLLFILADRHMEHGWHGNYSDAKLVSIEEIISILLTKSIKIGSYNVEFVGKNIKVGCQEVDFATVEEIYKELKKRQ